MKHISQNTIDKIGASISREIEENLLNGLLFGTDCTAQIMQDTTKSQGEVNWSDKTADQILDDINSAQKSIWDNSTAINKPSHAMIGDTEYIKDEKGWREALEHEYVFWSKERDIDVDVEVTRSEGIQKDHPSLIEVNSDGLIK